MCQRHPSSFFRQYKVCLLESFIYHVKSIFTLSRTLKDKMKYIIFHSKALTVNIESLLENIKSMTLPHASMSVPRRSITISHSSMTLPHSSMTHGQASISFPHSSIILSHKSITFPHSPISLPHKSMALPHSPKYGCFKRMRTCFTLISRKTGAIFSLSFFRQYKVCLIWQNKKTKQQITNVFRKVLADGSNSAIVLSFGSSFGRPNNMGQSSKN